MSTDEKIPTVTPAEIENILVAETGVSPGTIRESGTTPLVDLGIDSLAVLQLQAALADRFGTELPEDVGGWTLAHIVAFVNGDVNGHVNGRR
ncbi:hypothetical protein FDG2_3682 [Candidatus Protofrankia californiensis]|uniref:Carrier domain-containing protein n=1 Tax=Candidatus Protofrankia californiensis TaxID=1839754 RepID=A0A1C3P067_9ACTN|nr:hypothetical protein FDG2_3682 [Candidatus Protofrankia californiensis]